MPKNKKKGKITINKIALVVISLFLGLFFVLSWWIHNFFSNLPIRLHFCNHTACIIFSLIWFLFAGIGIFLLTRKTKFKRFKYIPYIVIGAVLIIGIIFMNITICDADGKIHFGISFLQSLLGIEGVERETCKPGVDCPGDIVEVPIPPCVETDDGRDYITFGTILSGADLDDLCMGDVLRERYCFDTLTYTSEDINCKTEYGDDWTCEEGECRREVIIIDDGGGIELFEDSLGLCTDETDNDLDGKTDCADEECIEFCECLHDSEFPSCLGYVEEGFVCSPMYTELGGWCVAMPEDETPCLGSELTMPIFCGGWCDDGMYCIHDLETCYCSDFPCRNTDGGYDIETPGACIGDDVWFYDSCAGDVLTEWECLGDEGCISHEVDCEPLWSMSGVCETDKFGVGFCMEEIL